MAILSAAELADLRATAAEFLDSTAVIFTRAIGLKDSYGAESAPLAEGETVACRLDLPSRKPTKQDAVEGGAQKQQQEFDLSLPFDTVVAENAEIVVTTPTGLAGTFAVIGPSSNRSWPAVLRLLVKRTSVENIAQAETSVFPTHIDNFAD